MAAGADAGPLRGWTAHQTGKMMDDAAGNAPELKADGIALVKGGRRIISDFSLLVRPGECVEITGSNGAGKTSLLRALAGIDTPSEGTIASPGDELVYLGHQDGLKADLTVTENLQFWVGVFDAPEGEDLVAAFRLAALQDRPVRLLSAGQRKRLAIATAFMSGRACWLLDEPLTSLDPDWADIVASMVLDHCRTGGLAVVTTLTKSLTGKVGSVTLPGTASELRA